MSDKSIPQKHTRIVQMVSKAIDAGIHQHAYGFISPQGTGRKLLAKTIASHYLDTQTPDVHPDYSEIDVSNDTASVEHIRSFIQFFSTSPIRSRGRVGIISNADFLSSQSQNALLKTLEEPPQHCLILLTFSSRKKILPTIYSRLIPIFVPIEYFPSKKIISHDLQSVFSSQPFFANVYTDIELQAMQESIPHIEKAAAGNVFGFTTYLSSLKETQQQNSVLHTAIHVLYSKLNQDRKNRKIILQLLQACTTALVKQKRVNNKLLIEVSTL